LKRLSRGEYARYGRRPFLAAGDGSGSILLLGIDPGTGRVRMSLKDRITDDMKTAMRSGEKERLGVIRMITSAIKQREVDERITLDVTASVLASSKKMIKQRKESLVMFQAGQSPGSGR